MVGMASATPVLDYRADLEDEFIVAVKVWRVPTPVLGSVHSFKYSLFFGRPGERLVGYDNERGKGDHRHFKGTKTHYAFSTVERLMADFWSDVMTLRGDK